MFFWVLICLNIRFLFKDWILELKLWSEDFGGNSDGAAAEIKVRWNSLRIDLQANVVWLESNVFPNFLKEKHFSVPWSLLDYCINVRWQKQMLFLWAQFSTSLHIAIFLIKPT